MEKQSVLINQASRICDVKTAIAGFDQKEKNYEIDLNEINDIVASCSDTIIARLQNKINDEDTAWYIGGDGRFVIQESFTGYLPDLNRLAEIIVKSL